MAELLLLAPTADSFIPWDKQWLLMEMLSLWGYFTVLFPSCHREGQGQPTLWTKSFRGLIETTMLGSETEESAHFRSQHLTELKQQQHRTAYK